MVANDKISTRNFFFKCCQDAVRIKKLAGSNRHIGTYIVQRPGNGIVLISGYHDSGFSPCKRFYCNIQCMSCVQRENDTLRLIEIKQSACKLPAFIDLIRSEHCRVVRSPARA